jgi:hypothetical protein
MADGVRTSGRGASICLIPSNEGVVFTVETSRTICQATWKHPARWLGVRDNGTWLSKSLGIKLRAKIELFTVG